MHNLKYYPFQDWAFEVMRSVLLETEMASNATNWPLPVPRRVHGRAIEAAGDFGDLHRVVGENFYVTTQCYSEAFPGRVMNGTQLTLVEASGIVPCLLRSRILRPQPAAVVLPFLLLLCSPGSYDFTIRTAVTPERSAEFFQELQKTWEELTVTPERSAEFFQELHKTWEELSDAATDTHTRATDVHLYRRRVREGVLRMGYYWYQFMPLTRGSAMVGIISILGLSLAADMETISLIPKDVQFMPLTRGSAMVGIISILGLSLAADMETLSLIPKNVQVRALPWAGVGLLAVSVTHALLPPLSLAADMETLSLIPKTFRGDSNEGGLEGEGRREEERGERAKGEGGEVVGEGEEVGQGQVKKPLHVVLVCPQRDHGPHMWCGTVPSSIPSLSFLSLFPSSPRFPSSHCSLPLLASLPLIVPFLSSLPFLSLFPSSPRFPSSHCSLPLLASLPLIVPFLSSPPFLSLFPSSPRFPSSHCSLPLLASLPHPHTHSQIPGNTGSIIRTCAAMAIPGNTGSIARTCAATAVPLHLVKVGVRAGMGQWEDRTGAGLVAVRGGALLVLWTSTPHARHLLVLPSLLLLLSLPSLQPLGFDITDSKLKRAGLDYWPFVVVNVHDSWGAFMEYFRLQVSRVSCLLS
ncbi:unnamed protein product [Closterium sp. Naga37s-1]|nr:unnamed protein product [Closterium sp. Naga37s-1]